MTATEKINTLTVGNKISHNGKIYEVKNIQKISEKINRNRLAVLEVGKPETYTREGKFLAAGQTFAFSNIRYIEVSTYKTENNWEIIA